MSEQRMVRVTVGVLLVLLGLALTAMPWIQDYAEFNPQATVTWITSGMLLFAGFVMLFNLLPGVAGLAFAIGVWSIAAPGIIRFDVPPSGLLGFDHWALIVAGIAAITLSVMAIRREPSIMPTREEALAAAGMGGPPAERMGMAAGMDQPMYPQGGAMAPQAGQPMYPQGGMQQQPMQPGGPSRNPWET